jgi:hypothetical protein
MKLGIMVNDLSGSQQGFYLINYMNYAVNQGHEVTVFYEIPSIPCVSIGFGIMQIHEAFSYDAPVIASNINLACKLASFPGPSEKFFYLWDLEWLRMPQKQYSMLQSIYRNPAYKLIARSKEHASVIESCWNVPVAGIVENFNIEHIVRMINAKHN